MSTAIDQQVVTFQQQFRKVKDEVSKVIVGYGEIIDGVIMSLLASGHVLLEGVPGLGKTKLVSTLSDVMHLKFSRIQFTPDLMPADITGTNMIHEDATGEKFLDFQPGPIFSNILLADEVNRATPKTQSALLEAMEERSVTVGKRTDKLDSPFFVLATQNPLEMEGTYPLPEAQLDRFFVKLMVDYPTIYSMNTIMNRRKDPCPAQQSRACFVRGHPGRSVWRSSPPNSSQLRRRGRTCGHGYRHQRNTREYGGTQLAADGNCFMSTATLSLFDDEFLK